MNLKLLLSAVICSGMLTACAVDQTELRGESGSVSAIDQKVVRTTATPAEHYQQYCALCHGEDREGYKNDHAPSLKTKSLFAAGPMVPFMSTAYGRPGTPMGPYLDELGGPMTESEIKELATWLNIEAGVEPISPRDMNIMPVKGDIQLGSNIYNQHCAACHGADGAGGTGTALGNVTMLATTPDSFLKAAIVSGREGTEMASFGSVLSALEIDGVVAFLRSRAEGWDADNVVFDTPPELDDIVLNPQGQEPDFKLNNGRYVSAVDLNAAIESGRKMILIDTRVPFFWAMAHIRGSLPVPYYSSREELIAALPNDGTWIVAYCECPRAAADSAVDRLRGLGYQNTAVLYEGYAGWASLGYPMAVGNLQ